MSLLSVQGPNGFARDLNGNLFVLQSTGEVDEVPFTNGSYGAPAAIGSGYPNSRGIAVDSHGDVFVANGNNVSEIPYSNGSYGISIDLNLPFINTQAVATDGNGRLYVVDSANIWLVAP